MIGQFDMATDLFNVKIHQIRRLKRQLVLLVTVINLDITILPQTLSFFLMALWTMSDKLKRQIHLNQTMDEEFVNNNIHKYIQHVEMVSIKKHEITQSELYGDCGTYVVTLTPQFWKLLEDELVEYDFNTTAFDLRGTPGVSFSPFETPEEQIGKQMLKDVNKHGDVILYTQLKRKWTRDEIEDELPKKRKIALKEMIAFVCEKYDENRDALFTQFFGEDRFAIKGNHLQHAVFRGVEAFKRGDVDLARDGITNAIAMIKAVSKSVSNSLSYMVPMSQDQEMKILEKSEEVFKKGSMPSIEELVEIWLLFDVTQIRALRGF